ncbi:MAG: hypothetical protein R3C03_11530 [Pirellulaceae bacterium]
MTNSVISGMKGVGFTSNNPDLSQTPVDADGDILVRSRNALASIYAAIGINLGANRAPIEERLAWFRKSLTIFEELEEKGELRNHLNYATLLSQICQAENVSGEYALSIQHGQKEVQVLEDYWQRLPPEQKPTLNSRLATAYSNLGRIVDSEENNERAIELLSLTKNRNRDVDRTLAHTLYNRSIDRRIAKRFQDAELDLLRAIEFLENDNDLPRLIAAYDEMILIATATNDSRKKEIFSEKAEKLRDQLGNNNPDAHGLLSSAMNDFNEGLELHKMSNLNDALARYDRAIDYLEKAQKISPEIKAKQVYFQSYWHRAEIEYEEMKLKNAARDYRKAIESIYARPDTEFDDRIAYLEASLRLCLSNESPISNANLIYLGNQSGSIEDETLTLTKRAAIYALAAKHELDLHNEASTEVRNNWQKRAVEVVEQMIEYGLVFGEVEAELKGGEDFESLQQLPEFTKIARLN